MLPGREKRGALASKVSQSSNFHTQISVSVPTTRPTHVLLTHSKDFRMVCASALDHPGESMTLRRWGSSSKGLKSLSKEIGPMKIAQSNGIAGHSMTGSKT